MKLKVKINGKNYEAEKGEYILAVCRRNHIPIPTLCHHDSLSGLGACRLCVVEVNEGGGNKVVVSCVYPLNRDCEVFTESEKIRGIRKTILSMLMTRAPEGERVASLCNIFGVERNERFTPPKPAEKAAGGKKPRAASTPLRAVSPAEKRLASSCVLCGLCARACASLGTGAISTVGRGVTKGVSTPYGEASADCVGCGSCAAVCPTKAIECTEDKGRRFIWGKEFKLIPCASCGKYFATEDEFALAMEKAAAVTAPAAGDALCDTCRRKGSADIFAAAFGERV